jgi:hypothetical protein
MKLTRNYSRVSSTPEGVYPAVVPVEHGDWPIMPEFNPTENTFKRTFKYYNMPTFVRHKGIVFLPSEKIAYARKTGKLVFEYQAKHTERRSPLKDTGEQGEWWERGEASPEYGEEEAEGQTLADWQWYQMSKEDPETKERTLDLESRLWVSFDRRDIQED